MQQGQRRNYIRTEDGTVRYVLGVEARELPLDSSKWGRIVRWLKSHNPLIRCKRDVSDGVNYLVVKDAFGHISRIEEGHWVLVDQYGRVCATSEIEEDLARLGYFFDPYLPVVEQLAGNGDVIYDDDELYDDDEYDTGRW